MTYDSMSQFAQTWGLLFFILMFAAVLAYAFWPRNREKFEAAAQAPLQDGPPRTDKQDGDEANVR